jgi:BirA family biotin operon repressor/biotin-[acetyl-CoA-carboxylase] ligase
MLTVEDLQAALAAIPVSAPVRADEVTGSTNATAMEMAQAGAPEWTLTSAAHQTEGRGREGREWVDVPGGSLLFSMVLRPSLAPARAGLLSLLAGACMADAIRAAAGRRVLCKWPNDLLLHEDKVGGILLASAVNDDVLQHVVVGVGVNLEAPEGVAGAGAIGARVGQRQLLTAFLTRFASIYTADDASLPARVRSAWLPLSATVGERVRATTTDGRDLEGRAVGVDDFGSLQLSTDQGELRVGFGDVEHLRPA